MSRETHQDEEINWKNVTYLVIAVFAATFSLAHFLAYFLTEKSWIMAALALMSAALVVAGLVGLGKMLFGQSRDVKENE